MSYSPLALVGMQPIWRTKQKKFSLLGIEICSHVKNLIVLSSKLAAFPRTCKESIWVTALAFIEIEIALKLL